MDATLANLVDQLDPMLAAPQADHRWRDRAAERVQNFRDAWAQYHASSNHEGGIYQDLEESDPRVSRLVRRLRDESLQLIERADIALATVRRPSATDAEARAAIGDLVLQARRYRSRETTATHEAMAVDLGSG